MPTNPFTDVWHFLTATTSDYLHQGNWRYLILALFWALLLISIAVAFKNWREDPAQRTGRHLGIWLVRVLIGCLWFQGMLWKLPLPVSDGLQHWTEQEFDECGVRVSPRLHEGCRVASHERVWANRVSCRAGIRWFDDSWACRAVRGRAGIAYTLQLWLGLYDNPSEWPWTYMCLALLMFLFVLDSAGRSLGLDAWLRRQVPAVRDGKGFVGWFFNISG